MDAPEISSAQSVEVSRLKAESQSLKDKASGLRDKEQSWNRLYRIASIVTVVVGGLGGGSIWLFGNFAGNAGEEARPLEQKREGIEGRVRELLDQLSAEKIALADRDAEIANNSAGKANKEAGKANERAGVLEKQAADLRAANLITEGKLTSANAEIAQLNAQRVSLEQTLYPRILYLGTMFIPPKNDARFTQLQKFSDTKVAFRYVRDAECARAMTQIKKVVEAAHWDVLSPDTPDDTRNESFWDGVNVEWPGPSIEEMTRVIPGEDHNARLDRLRVEVDRASRLTHAADELAAYLRAMGWEAHARPAGKEAEFPLDAIQVVVGFKPLPYFDPQVIKEVKEKVNKIEEQIIQDERKEDEMFPPEKPPHNP